jgi:hypothetical protein
VDNLYMINCHFQDSIKSLFYHLTKPKGSDLLFGGKSIMERLNVIFT